ncbi:hypothetical protein K438DRAFT_1775226 [Mycena galopus ATCC 62051]|nr:hypothetical protein K438DRAFT_1775226 [Mycena galopus ATCC 62051]
MFDKMECKIKKESDLVRSKVMCKVWIFSPTDISPPVADNKHKEIVPTAHQRRAHRAHRQASYLLSPPVPPTMRAFAEDRLGALPTLASLPPALGASSSSLPLKKSGGGALSKKEIRPFHSSAPSAEIEPSTDDRQGKRAQETRNSPAAARNERRKRPEGRNRAQREVQNTYVWALTAYQDRRKAPGFPHAKGRT